MLYNNLPTTPGAILGYRRNGQPIRLIAGASGETDPAPVADPPAQPDPTTPAHDPAPVPAPPADPAPAPGAPAAPTDVSQLPDWAQKMITETRKEAGDHRVKLRDAEAAAKTAQAAAQEAASKHAAMLDTIAKGLGLKDDDSPPDPAKLAEQLTAAQAETARKDAEKREADVKLAVYMAAGNHEANAVALVDSLSFQRSVKDLDPAADDFADRIGEAITKAIETNPLYKVTPPKAEPKAPVKAKSGGEFTGTPGGNRQWTDEDVNAHSPAQVAKAIEDGLLVDMGFHPKKPDR
jgi:hypothetical protein